MPWRTPSSTSESVCAHQLSATHSSSSITRSCLVQQSSTNRSSFTKPNVREAVCTAVAIVTLSDRRHFDSWLLTMASSICAMALNGGRACGSSTQQRCISCTIAGSGHCIHTSYGRVGINHTRPLSITGSHEPVRCWAAAVVCHSCPPRSQSDSRACPDRRQARVSRAPIE